ncbi:MAG: DUF2974 domain-containing protein [Lachnospiraceae bacterium]|nr:DUF2974 domain-containing protein [Lachnospiraceae bacterium]MBQ8328565.1 DUF2974 domain-containing protein [Lachnospiraceae bacterium]
MDERNNMNEYLKWRGDLTFDRDPFNDVDNLILAQLAYVDYDGIVFESRDYPMPIKDVCRRYWEIHTVEEIRNRESFSKRSPFLLRPAAESKRFGNTKMCGYVNFVSKSAEAQMSAVQFELEDGTVYVAFRGTDETLVGWKEDFNLSYMSSTEGQKLAVDYLRKNFSDTALKLRVGGHSKGGNFAAFASSFAGARVQKQILAVYCNDSPGFRDEVTSRPEYKEIMDRTINIIPQDSIIGRLLNGGRSATVVRSSRKGIMQHDALSWEVLGNRFVNTQRSGDSIYLEKVLNEWLENVDDAARRVFVDQIFGILQALGADTLKDMKDISLRDLADAIQMVKGLPKEQQSEMSDVIKKLVASGSKNFYEEMEQRDGLVPDVFKKLLELKGKISEARKTAEYARLGVQAARAQRAQLTKEDTEEVQPAEENSEKALLMEELAKRALKEGILIGDGKTDDTDGEDPQ